MEREGCGGRPDDVLNAGASYPAYARGSRTLNRGACCGRHHVHRAGDVAREASGEGQPEARAGPARRRTTASRLEDPLPVGGGHAGAVVLDHDLDRAAVGMGGHDHTRGRVPERVVHHRIEDPGGQVGVDRDPQRPVSLRADRDRPPVVAARAAIESTTSAASDTPRSPPSWRAAATSASIVRRRSSTLRVIASKLSRASAVEARPRQRELALGRDPRERRP